MDSGQGRGRGPPPPPDAMNGIYQCLRELTSLVQHQNRNNNNHTGGAHSLAQVPGNREENRRMIILRELLRQSPPTFQGSSNPLDVDRWIRRVTKVFDGLGVAEDFKVGLTTYLFDGEVDHWWESVKRRRDISALTWGEFVQIFQNKYFLKSIRDRMKADFLALQHGSTIVVEYERRFTELFHYAMNFISTEANRAKLFEQGLRSTIQEKLVALKIRDYGDMVDRSALMERDIEDSQRRQSWVKGGPIRTGVGSSGV